MSVKRSSALAIVKMKRNHRQRVDAGDGTSGREASKQATDVFRSGLQKFRSGGSSSAPSRLPMMSLRHGFVCLQQYFVLLIYRSTCLAIRLTW